MSLKEFISNERDIAKFKLQALNGSSRPYRMRLANYEREFLSLNLVEIFENENEARYGCELYRISKVDFYKKYGKKISNDKNYNKIKESLILRKRILFNFSELLSNKNKYLYSVKNAFSYSNLLSKKQEERFFCGTKSVGKYIQDELLKVQKEIPEINKENIHLAGSLIDFLVESIYENWYCNYNYFIKKIESKKIHELIKIVNKNFSIAEFEKSSFIIPVKLRSVGNEHLRPIFYKIKQSDGKCCSKKFKCRIRSIRGKRAVCIDAKSDIDSNEVFSIEVLSPKTRTESVALSELDVYAKEVCDDILSEYYKVSSIN